MHDMIAIAAALVVAVVVWQAMKRGRVAPAEAVQLVKQGAVLVDVRSPAEYALGHVTGALNLTIDQLRTSPHAIGARDGMVIVYCRSGARSAVAARLLRAAGFAHVYDLGPIAAWPREHNVLTEETGPTHSG